MRNDTLEPLDVDGLICVEPPYFALRDLSRVAPGEIVADIPVEAPAGLQTTPLGISEIGRHLAIAGLCAASTVNPRPGRHFYLARAARGRWHLSAAATAALAAEGLTVRARAGFPAPRRAAAETALHAADGTLLATLDVEYDVMTRGVFARVVGEPVPDVPAAANPYARALPLEDLTVRGGHGSARLAVTPGMCPGHFAGHPVLPVATLSSGMTALVDAAVAARGTGARWRPVTWWLSAEKLAHAGQTVVFEGVVEHAAEDPKGAMGAAGALATFRGTARVGAETVAEGGVELVLVGEGAPPGAPWEAPGEDAAAYGPLPVQRF
ncbi:hypothetical protein [Streptomyces sp. NPDC094032]|uniref:hypothetical protein n=1 Tax=Streptomyces sp. NPDC094032 TaxID=3155308 RepID=UPI003329D04E